MKRPPIKPEETPVFQGWKERGTREAVRGDFQVKIKVLD